MASDKESLASKLQELTDNAKQPEGARNALALLFPKADEVLQTYVPGDYLTRFGRMSERRISEPDFASVYFRLDATPISWSSSELEEIFKLGPEKGLNYVEERVASVPKNDGAKLRRLFLDFLTGSVDSGFFNQDWLVELLAVSPAYVSERERTSNDLFGDQGFLPFARLIFQALQRFPTTDRFSMFAHAIDVANDLSVLTDFFRSTVGDTNPDGSKNQRDHAFFGQGTNELRERLVQRVRSLATSGHLWSQASPERLLWFWWGSDYEQEVAAFLSEAIQDPVTLREVLNLVIATVVSSNGPFERVSNSYRKLIDFDKLTEKANGLLDRRLESEDATLVTRYMTALKRSEESSF